MTTVNVISDSLNISEPSPIDESIESQQYREYEPQNPLAVNSNQAIQIDIQNQDIFTQPSKSFLYIEGELASTDATNAYAVDTKVSLINNAIPYMFSQMRFLLNNTEIESIMNPGQATTMKGLLTIGAETNLAEGLNMCWKTDSSTAADDANLGFKARRNLIVSKPVPIGTFSFCIPLKNLFGFCEDYTKVIYGVKQSLLLSRQTDDDAIYHDTPAAGVPADGKIKINKISWFMPHIQPSIDSKLMLEKVLSTKTKIPVAFRSMQCDTIAVPQSTSFSWRLTVKTGTEKPRWLVVGFQTAKSSDQLKNPALFDHLRVTNIYALLNSDRYPLLDQNLDFTQCKISKAYKTFCDFRKDYYGIADSSHITPVEFIDLFPLFVIDLRNQSEKLKNSVQDIQIKTTFAANAAANTLAYALLISDRLIHLQSDGSKFQMIY
jgi:hypothetical protein